MSSPQEAPLAESPVLGALLEDRLTPYAETLRQNGFTVYVHPEAQRGDGTFVPARWFAYSRVVNGRTLFGNVQIPNFSRLGFPCEHHMPIRPSREHGSSMFVPDADRLPWDSVMAALMVTRERNTNPIVGTHQNYDKSDDWFHKRAMVFEPTGAAQ